jgi:SAM-dependent methyltransferase
VHFEVGDILDLPVPDDRYDAVLAVAVIHYVPSEAYRAQAMAELARATRPGGYLLMTSWNLWQPRFWKILLHQICGWRNGWDFGDLKITWKKPYFPRYYHVFRMKEMRRLVEGAGLEITEQYYVKHGEIVTWLRGENLVTICRKPEIENR